LQKEQTAEKTTSPIYAFLEKPSMIDYPGHLCGVFFTSGCNFSCGFCHNAALMGRKQKTLSWERVEEVCRKFKDEWVDAVCITGGEPSLQPGLIELIHFFRDRGFKIKLDSNGSHPEILASCLPQVDLVAMDIKSGPAGYAEIAGFADIEKIKESIALIKKSGVDYEFRTTVIEPFHTDEQMLEAGELIKGAKRYCLQAFVPQDTLPGEAFRSLKRTTPERLRRLEKLMAPFAEEVVVRGA
jgi:pyruvate formate lyase activating enzyme